MQTLTFTGIPLVAAKGGSSADTLRFAGADLSLDLRGGARVTSVESIDLTGSGDNTLLLDDAAVRRVPQNRSGLPGGLRRSLVLRGDPGDRVVLDLSLYPLQTTRNAGRDVWVRDGAVYGLEATPGLIVPPE